MVFDVSMAPRAADRPEVRAGRHLVEAMVASAFAVGSEVMHAPGRGPARVAFARQVAMYLARTRLGLTLTDTGALFGRDRTTAAHACRIVEERREDPRIDAIVNVLEQAIAAWVEFDASECAAR